MESRIYTVSQVNGYVKAVLSEDVLLSDITITGELSGVKRQASGHLYFSIKDDGAAISAAMFKWQCQSLRFVPQNGMKVIAKGKITLYEPTGSYQIVVSSMQPSGIGELYAAYERLKEKLESEGLFSPERKRPLPAMPRRIGVVTSGTGAAVRDITSILARRWPVSEIVLCPVAVQGANAPAEICAAINALNERNACDVMIVGRGGGSMEDLWCFNDETIARTVAASKIPVISAVGHETDFTICDFAADLRAPTPSAAAELAVPDREILAGKVESIADGMAMRMSEKLSRFALLVDSLKKRPCFASPLYPVEQREQRVGMAADRAGNALESRLSRERERLAASAGRLAALNPMAVLSRGYGIAYCGGRAVSSVAELSRGDEVRLKLSDGFADCTVKAALPDTDGGNE